MKKSNNRATLSWIKGAVPSSSRSSVIFLTALGVLIAVLSTYSAVLIKGVIDSAVGGGNGLLTSLIVYGTYIVVLLLLEIGFSLLSVRTTAKTEMKLRRDVMSDVVGKDYKAVSAYHSGDVMSRATMDVNVVSNAVTQVLPSAVSVLAKVISAFVILFMTDYMLALIVFLTAPITLVASTLYGRKIKALHHKGQRLESKNRSFMTEIVQNMTVIRAFRSQKPVFDYYAGLQDESYGMKMKINRFSVLANVLMFVSVSLVYFFTLLWGANKIIAEGVMAFGALTATLQLVTQFQSPLRSFAGITNQYYRALASAERIKEFDLLKDGEGAIEVGQATEFSALTSEGLSFAYDDAPIIKDLTFSVKRGEVAVVTGRSGAGKSTLLKLIMGLLTPTKGRVYLEGTESEADKSVFSYVPQGNMILSGTIRENVTFFSSGVSDEAIYKALELCCLDDVIGALPNGLDSRIGERGAGLSEGQVQRLSIARALLMNKKILLLDEATSALDAETEAKVLDNLVSQDYTVVLVTHNKSVQDKYENKINID